MIKRLHKLRSARGFTMVEMVIVLAVLAVLVGTVFAGANTTNKRIKEAESTATDFYSALQLEFTNLQMYDGPVTMTLSKIYTTPTTEPEPNISSLGNSKYGGIKYYPYASGNYPFDISKGTPTDKAAITHESPLKEQLDDTPKTADLYLCFFVSGNQLQNVTWANTLADLLAQNPVTGDGGSELEAVFEREMANRMSYKSGYYYARVHYDAPTAVDPTAGAPSSSDYRTSPVKVLWTAYVNIPMSASDTSSTTFRSVGMLDNGHVCGVCKTEGYEAINRTGSNLLNPASYSDPHNHP